jgi:prepilin-type N-terminal cleavage/methylation domain-containing protein
MIFKFHRHKGFALMEVMIALAMIAVLLSTLMMVQSKVFSNVISSTFKIERFYSIRNMFLLTKIKPLEDDKKSWEKTIEDPETKLTYEKKSIKKESQLSRFKGLFQEVATGTWHEWGRERAYDIISYQFDPPKKEKKNESP